MIYLVDNIHPEGIDILKKAHFEVNIGDSLFEEEIVKGARNAEAIIIRSQGKLTEKIISGCQRLKCIGRYGVGVDNIDIEIANRLKIPIVYAPGVNSKAVAEHVLMFALAISRKMVLLNRRIREGRWKELRDLEFYDLSGRTLGILGVGSVGSELNKIAGFFSMKVIGYDPYLSQSDLSQKGVKPVDWVTLFRESDILSAHVPLNSETKKLIGEKELHLMKRGGILINTSRGGIVDEEALARVLQEGHLSGVGLDVFEEEPLKKDHPLLQFENVFVTPHSAGLTSGVLKELAIRVCKGVVMVLQGKRPENVFNPNVFNCQRE
jgi:D-3-phosphoglycerate dehydrogenase